MRIWTLHPRYLDTKGLVALWREGLLAQAVLKGDTRGYRNHPQLQRFNSTNYPLATIASYLQAVEVEAKLRHYNFNGGKIGLSKDAEKILVTENQLLYEWKHLLGKLFTRAPLLYSGFQELQRPDPHPLFIVIPGPVADWEIQTSKQSASVPIKRRSASK